MITVHVVFYTTMHLRPIGLAFLWRLIDLISVLGHPQLDLRDCIDATVKSDLRFPLQLEQTRKLPPAF